MFFLCFFLTNNCKNLKKYAWLSAYWEQINWCFENYKWLWKIDLIVAEIQQKYFLRAFFLLFVHFAFVCVVLFLMNFKAFRQDIHLLVLHRPFHHLTSPIYLSFLTLQAFSQSWLKSLLFFRILLSQLGMDSPRCLFSLKCRLALKACCMLKAKDIHLFLPLKVEWHIYQEWSYLFPQAMCDQFFFVIT